MDITFIYPEINSEINSRGSYHFGIGWLAACLKKAGHKVNLLHLTKITEKDVFLALLKQKDTKRLIAISSTTNDFHYVKQLTVWIKEKYDFPIICGGKHPTIAPEATISCDGIDMICIGEGEAALVELCNNIDNGMEICEIKNIWIKRNGKIFKNPIRPGVSDLDSLPYPDRQIFNYESLEEMGERRLTIMAARGCPYNCSYCCNHAFKALYNNKEKYVRFRSAENIIGEIEKGMSEYPSIERVFFHDDILPLNRKWFEEFAALYKKKIAIPFICNTRVNLINKEIVKILKEAGCVRVGMGIESGNDDIRTTVLNRKISRDQIISAFKECDILGLKTYAFNMVGLPFESNKTVLDTVKLNAIVKPSKLQTSIFYPYPFTHLYNLCLEKGYIRNEEVVDDYFKDSIIRLDTISREGIKFFRNYFRLLVSIYRGIYFLPPLFQKPLEWLFDRLLCWPYLPYNFLITIEHRFNLRTFLRSKFPNLYFRIRPYIKKLQYRRK